MSAGAGVRATPAAAPTSKAHELRALTSPRRRARSTSVGVAFAVADYLLFYAGAAAFILAPWWTVKLAGVAVSGIAVAMLFALAHDAAHGSLAASRGMNRLLATLCFLPSWYPYTPWIRGHNHLHHGWTNVAECDYSWRPVSPATTGRCRAGGARSSTSYRSWWGLWAAFDRRDLVEAHGDAARRAIAATSTRGISPPIGCSWPPSSPRTSRVCWLVGAAWSTLAGGPALRAGGDRRGGRGRALVDLPRDVLGGDVPAPHAPARALVPHEAASRATSPARCGRPCTSSCRPGSSCCCTTSPFTARITWTRAFRSGTCRRRSAASSPHSPRDVIVERWSLRSFIAVTRVCKLYDYDAHEWHTFRSASEQPVLSASRVVTRCAAPPTGSRRDARRAGTAHAAIVAAQSRRQAAMYASGSSVRTP